jgi:hypothetical protein
MTPDVLYTIVALSVAGGAVTVFVVDLVGQYVWAGRRQFPRGHRNLTRRIFR